MRDILDQRVAGTVWGTAFLLVFSLTPGVVAVAGCGCRRRCAAMGALWGRYGGGIPSRAGLSHASGKLMIWIKNYELTLSLPVATVGLIALPSQAPCPHRFLHEPSRVGMPTMLPRSMLRGCCCTARP